MEKELDLATARFIKEQQDWERQEEVERLLKQFDPKENTTYTLEELMEGIRKGEQQIYTELLEFEPRRLLDGRITVPYIRDFFDLELDEPESAFFVSNRNTSAMTIADAPCEKVVQPLEEWITGIIEPLKEYHWHMKPTKKKSMGSMEYFCFVMPTAKGKLYNVMFRYHKAGRLYVGAMNCPEEEKEGMGLLLEAMVYVIGEMNR